MSIHDQNELPGAVADSEPARESVGVHVDTTLQIERFKTNDRAKLVTDALVKFTFRSTSTYAKYEFNRTLLRDLAYLYARASKASQVGDVLADILRSFGNRGGPFNRLTRCTEQIIRFLQSRSKGMTVDTEIVQFRETIALMLLYGHKMWDQSVDHQFSATGCVRAMEKPERASNDKIIFTLSDCRREKINCDIHNFFRRHEGNFLKIRERADSSDSEQLKTAGTAIEKATEDPERLCDNRRCAELGDAIIAVDSEDVPTLAANNDSDWQPIADAVGKRLINPFRPESFRR